MTMAYPSQTLIVQKPGKKRKPGPLSMPVELVNPDGSPFTGGGQSITSVEVSTLFANQPATAELEGTVLKLGIPKGETGPAGIAGQQGPKGDKGDTGAQGPAGADGTSFTPCAAVPDVSGEDAAAAIATVNALLASLRAGGVLNAS